MFKIKVKGLNKLKRSIVKSPRMVFAELSGAIKTSLNIIRPMMRQETPVKSGKLSRHIFVKASGLEGSVGPDVAVTPYAWFVHQGTRPHVIEPKHKKALYWKGALHPVRKVKHPGTKANPFVERTFDKSRQPVQAIFSKAVDKIISNFHKG